MECWSKADGTATRRLYYDEPSTSDEEAPAASYSEVKKGDEIDKHTAGTISQDKIDAILFTTDDGSIVGDNPPGGNPSTVATVTGEEAPALGATGEEANSEQHFFRYRSDYDRLGLDGVAHLCCPRLWQHRHLLE